jgi:DeoR/GlpR family transcriptional regulator of sugar metabolism
MDYEKIIKLRKMLKEKRVQHILTLLESKDMVTYELLAHELKVSSDTIRRDIDLLDKNGLLSKVRGGAMLRSRNPFSFQDRSTYLQDGKNIIALKAQQLINKAQNIFMDGGTTICAIATQLPINSSFKVITNNQALIPILSKFKDIEIVVLGGLYNRDTETNYGGQTINEVGKYVADLYLMGTCAIHPDFGITAALQNDGEVKQAMLQAAAKTFALSNGEKLNSIEHFKVADFKEVDGLITDLASNDTLLNDYRKLNLQIL